MEKNRTKTKERHSVGAVIIIHLSSSVMMNENKKNEIWYFQGRARFTAIRIRYSQRQRMANGEHKTQKNKQMRKCNLFFL